jgi:hypothetical protein
MSEAYSRLLPHWNNPTGFRGVRVEKRTGRFTASIVRDGTRFHLGTFPTAEIVGAAYIDAHEDPEKWLSTRREFYVKHGLVNTQLG